MNIETPTKPESSNTWREVEILSVKGKELRCTILLIHIAGLHGPWGPGGRMSSILDGASTVLNREYVHLLCLV